MRKQKRSLEGNREGFRQVKRRDGDYYPTTPDAIFSLRLAVEAGLSFVGGRYARDLYLQGSFLDPSSGAGSLLSKFPPPGAATFGIEINENLASSSREHFVVVGDALAMEWPGCEVIIANPPFSLMRQFCDRIIEHVNRVDGVAFVLCPTQWIQASRQADMPCPNLALMSWRPSFIPRGLTTSGPRQTYAWATWLSEKRLDPRVGILKRPRVTEEDEAEHLRVFKLT
jgi:hypothetical protein